MRKHILLVDNDQFLLEALGDALQEAGYQVVKARTGLEALRHALVDPPDAIILDLIMPVMDGRTLSRHLQEDPNLRAIPRIVLTAALSEDLPSLQELNAVAYIAKRRLVSVVKDLLDVLRRLEEEGPANFPLVKGLAEVRPRGLAREFLAITRHLDTVLASLGEAVIELDGAFRIVYMNPAAVKLLGRIEREMMGIPISEVLDAGQIGKFLERLAESRDRVEEEMIYEGRVFKLTLTALIDQEKPAGALMVLQDMSLLYQRLHELTVLNQVSSAFASTLDFSVLSRLVMEQVVGLMKAETGSLLLKDEKTGELVFSVVLGRYHETLQGRRLKADQGIAGWVAASGQQAMVTDAQKDPRFTPVVDNLTGFRTQTLLCTPMKTGEKVLGVIEVINRIDGTSFTQADLNLLSAIASHAASALENARLHERLAESKERLFQASFQESRLINQLSHELRTPLTVLLGYIELLMEEQVGPLTTRQKQYLQNVYRSGQQIMQLTSDVFDLARVEEGRTEFQLEHFNPADVLEEVRALMTPVAAEKDLKIIIQGDPSVGQVEGDLQRFRQVLLNLVSNAMKFTREKGEILLGATLRDPDTLQVFVKDNGLGIPREALHQIFEPFNKGELAVLRQIPGVGLGLALARRLVELQGGQIWAESEGEGQGSTFTFILPISNGSS
jgi:PAS domain S-box-containing protein